MENTNLLNYGKNIYGNKKKFIYNVYDCSQQFIN